MRSQRRRATSMPLHGVHVPQAGDAALLQRASRCVGGRSDEVPGQRNLGMRRVLGEFHAAETDRIERYGPKPTQRVATALGLHARFSFRSGTRTNRTPRTYARLQVQTECPTIQASRTILLTLTHHRLQFLLTVLVLRPAGFPRFAHQAPSPTVLRTLPLVVHWDHFPPPSAA